MKCDNRKPRIFGFVLIFMLSVFVYADDLAFIGTGYMFQQSNLFNNEALPDSTDIDSLSIDFWASHEDLKGIFFSLGFLLPLSAAGTKDGVQADSSDLLTGCFGLKAKIGYFFGLASSPSFSLGLGLGPQLVWTNYMPSQDVHDMAQVGVFANLAATIKLSEEIYLSPEVSGSFDLLAIGGSSQFTSAFYDGFSFNAGLYIGFIIPSFE